MTKNNGLKFFLREINDIIMEKVTRIFFLYTSYVFLKCMGHMNSDSITVILEFCFVKKVLEYLALVFVQHFWLAYGSSC